MNGAPLQGPSPGADPCEDVLERFEVAWRAGAAPRIEDYLPSSRQPADDRFRSRCLVELVKLDLEYRWRFKPTGCTPWTLEDYTARYPDLGPTDRLPVELIGEEYRVRQCWGDRPGHEPYLRKFARLGEALRAILRSMDRKIADEPRPQPSPSTSQPATPVPALSSAAEVMEALRRYELVSAARLREAQTTGVLDRCAEPRALAGELLRRDWLTAYQVNQVLQGRGANLVVGPYLLLERLGEGGIGQVFKARHQPMDRLVALKLVRRDLLNDPETIARFNREIMVISQLSHPNVVHALDAGSLDSSYFLAMEFLEGKDLYQLVKERGPLPIAQACDHVRQAALGLQHAFEKGIVHRDIKPSNLLLTTEGVVKVLDLGLARLHRSVVPEGTPAPVEGDNTRQLTPAGALFVMGTPDYLAPDQAFDFHGADIRADIYSLGCTLYYLLTGQPPFSGATLAEKLVKHQQARPAAVTSLRPEVPSALLPILDKMLAKQPADRYQMPADVAEALSPFARGRLPGAGRRRRRFLLAAGSVVLGAGVLALAWKILGKRTLGQLPEGRYAGWPREVVAILGTPGKDRLHGIAFNPDGTLLATASADGMVHVWDPIAGKEKTTLKGHTGGATAVAFAPSGKTLASGDAMGNLKLWDVGQGQEIEQLANLKNHIFTIAYSPDGKVLAAGFGSAAEAWSQGHVNLWNVDKKALIANLPGPGNSRHCVAFAADSRSMATVEVSGPLKIFDAATGRSSKTFDKTTDGWPGSGVAFSPDGQQVALWKPDGFGQVWDVRDQRPIANNPITPSGRYLAYLPDGSGFVLVCGPKPYVCLMDPAFRQRRRLELPTGLEDAALAPDGRHLAIAHGDGTVSIIRLSSPSK